MANWYFTIDEIVSHNDWFIRLVFLRTYSTETMEIGNRRKYIIPLSKLNKKELAGFADMSRPTIQKYADDLPLGEYSFVPLLGRTLEYDTKQIDQILTAAKTMHGGARNDFVKVTFYAIGLINKHGGSYSHSLKQFAEELLLNYSTVQKHIDVATELKLFNRAQTGNSFSGESSIYSLII
jgi:hypothetical protein